MNLKSTVVPIVLCLFTALTAESVRADEFQKIFDGESLKGWKALNMSYWSVRDGAITGQSTPENPCKANQFMAWQGGDVADFELKLKFRVKGNGGNSGESPVPMKAQTRPPPSRI